MADTQSKVKVASLGTRETVLKARVVVAATAAANALHQTAVTFDTAFSAIPDVLGISIQSDGASRGVANVNGLSTTGFTMNLIQTQTVDVNTGSHNIDVVFSGTRAI